MLREGGARLERQIETMLSDPEIVARLDKLGYVPVYKDSSTFEDFVVADLTKWKETARGANISL